MFIEDLPLLRDGSEVESCVVFEEQPRKFPERRPVLFDEGGDLFEIRFHAKSIPHRGGVFNRLCKNPQNLFHIVGKIVDNPSPPLLFLSLFHVPSPFSRGKRSELSACPLFPHRLVHLSSTSENLRKGGKLLEFFLRFRYNNVVRAEGEELVHKSTAVIITIIRISFFEMTSRRKCR